MQALSHTPCLPAASWQCFFFQPLDRLPHGSNTRKKAPVKNTGACALANAGAQRLTVAVTTAGAAARTAMATTTGAIPTAGAATRATMPPAPGAVTTATVATGAVRRRWQYATR